MKGIVLAAAVMVALNGLAYHEYSYGNNVNPSALGQGAADGAASREIVAVGYDAGRDADTAIQDVFIGNAAGRTSGNTTKVIGIGYNALGDAHDLRNVVALGNYELAGLSGMTNVTSINNGQIYVNGDYDLALIRPNGMVAPTNSPFAYIAGDTFIGGTGTTYIAGNVVFGGRTVIQDNSFVGGGGSTARLAGSGDLADMTVPYSSGDCDVFVSPQGSDSNPGTVLLPYLTLDKALQACALVGRPDMKIGVMAGDYAYPTMERWQTISKIGVRLIGLEGAAKTRISMVATGYSEEQQWLACTDSTVASAMYDKGCLTNHDDQHSLNKNFVIGFTLDGRTRRSAVNYSYGTYGGVYFRACRFTGVDCAQLRRNGYLLFSNCILDNCYVDAKFHAALRFRSYADSCVFFACYLYNTIVENIRKSSTGLNWNSSDGTLYSDCEFQNSLCMDTNLWQAALHYEVTENGMYDSAVVFQKDSRPVFNESGTRRHALVRSIFAVGNNTAKGATWERAYIDEEDSYVDSWSEVKAITDDNFYPLDEALELFGIGYNNMLTRKFKDYLRTKDYQGRDGVGIIDLKNTDAMLMKAEDGMLNLYTVTAVEGSTPVRPLFALFKAEASAGNDVYASTSLGDAKRGREAPDPKRQRTRVTATAYPEN